MTEDELQAIEARANAATPGPWTCETADATVVADTKDGDVAVSFAPVFTGEEVRPRHRADGEFIAAARTDMPALVAEVRRLQALTVEASGAIEHLLSGNDYEHDDCCYPLLEKLKT